MSPVLRALFIPVALTLLLSLSDCIRFTSWSDRSNDPDPTPTAEPAKPTPTPFATPWPTPTPRIPATPTPVPSPTPEPEPGMTQDELDALLLQLDDLPTAWKVADVDDPPTDVPGVDDGEHVLASAFYQQSDLGPYLVHMLLYTEGEREAEAAFEAIEKGLDSADILDGITDQVRSWETEPADFEDLGDETFAYKAVGDTGLIPVEADMVGTRQGQYVSFIIHAELMLVDTDLTERFVEGAIDRLPAE
jgi:hypothetical protein